MTKKELRQRLNAKKALLRSTMRLTRRPKKVFASYLPTDQHKLVLKLYVFKDYMEYLEEDQPSKWETHDFLNKDKYDY